MIGRRDGFRSVTIGWFPNPKATQAITTRFALPANGDEQDWDLELSDPDRIADFLDELEALNCQSPEHRDYAMALAAITISSFDDLFRDNPKPDSQWDRFSVLLKRNDAVFAAVLEHWSHDGAEDDGFAVTPHLKSVLIGHPDE